MKKIVIALTVLLCGCEPSYKYISTSVLPPELKDCKMFSITPDDSSVSKVMWCPNSVTTSNSYNEGKITKDVTTIIKNKCEN